MSRPPIPLVLKSLLVSLWNAAHHAGWAVRDHAGAIAAGRIERCSVCGRTRPMVYRRRVIPPKLAQLWGLSPELARALARKETLDCSGCGAKLRCRRIARTILNVYSTKPAVRSLAEWVQAPEAARLCIAEINRIDGVHDVLGRLPNFSPSDYIPGAQPGAIVAGTRSEDVTRLTYSDGCFDLVLTSETLEHAPDLEAALAEIRRVLIPGGRHIFTIPMLPNVRSTHPRIRRSPDGRWIDVEPRIHHPGGDWGYLVYTEFGRDFLEILDRAGFDAQERFGPPSAHDLAQVIVATRRP